MRGLSVVGVSTDGAGWRRDFWKDIKQDYTVLLGMVQWNRVRSCGTATTFILDREGRIRAKIVIGEKDANFLKLPLAHLG